MHSCFQLVPTDYTLPNKGGYFFYYSLFGNDVTSEPFSDLVEPNFAAERSSVRLRSTLVTLKEFFDSEAPLQVCMKQESCQQSIDAFLGQVVFILYYTHICCCKGIKSHNKLLVRQFFEYLLLLFGVQDAGKWWSKVLIVLCLQLRQQTNYAFDKTKLILTFHFRDLLKKNAFALIF